MGSVASCCMKREAQNEDKPHSCVEEARSSKRPKLDEKSEKAEEKVDDTNNSAWAVHLGPVTVGSDGVEVKPQMKVGAEAKNFSAEIGVSDVRDGLKVAAAAQMMVDATAEGKSLAQLHHNIKCDTVGFKEALHVAKTILGSGKNKASQLAKIAEVLGIGTASLEIILGKRHGTDRPEGDDSEDDNPVDGDGETDADAEPQLLQLRVEGSVGVGVSAEVRLGWADSQGYHMFGCGGKAAAGAGVGADVFAGKHNTGNSAMIILGIGNFMFEYTFPLKKKTDQTA